VAHRRRNPPFVVPFDATSTATTTLYIFNRRLPAGQPGSRRL